ncbi:MAG: ABC transporter permease subunit, partial [Sphingomonadales bacterium]
MARGVRPFTRFWRATTPGWADAIAFVMLAGLAVLVIRGAEGIAEPLSQLRMDPVVLDLWNLPAYAMRTTLRMFAALGASLIFTFVVATLAAKSKRAEMVIVPALDILQSVPILGFLTFTVTFFMSLFPGQQLGVELAAIFAIFTSQAWNMAFSFYQSLRSIPSDLEEVSRGFALSPWRRFLRLELPFATPALVWNAMMSMSGGWFFVVASEAISVGNTRIMLPGIGSWLALAIDAQDFHAVGWAVAAMAVVILIYDQLVFRPVVAWADRF